MYLILILLFSIEAYALPKKFEVWFINTKTSRKQSFIPGSLLEKPFIFYSKLAQARQCQPMGDYCFDPQIGMYKLGEDDSVKAKDHQAVHDDSIYEAFDNTGAIERNMIKCDKGNMFDLFCGKAQKQNKLNEKISLWVDISSSMRQVDFESHDQVCVRESFVRRLNQTCKFREKMRIEIYNENKKELGTFDQLCLDHGLNNPKRLIQQIKENNSPYLLIITDIFEAHSFFIDFIEMNGGTHRGVDSSFHAEDLMAQLPRIKNLCQ